MSATDDFVTPLLAALESYAAQTGYFDSVSGHEPKNAPANGITAAVWWNRNVPARSSGLSETSVVVLCTMRIYTSAQQDNPDLIDPNLTAAVSGMFLKLSNNFTLGGKVRAVDLLGMENAGRLEARSGWLPIGGEMFRIADITIPLITNDVYDQAP